MIEGRHEASSEPVERVALNREYRAIVQKFRLEQLGGRLSTAGPMEIVYWHPGFSDDRLRIVTQDRTALRLKLYWPCREPLATLCSLAWRDGDGWQITVTTANGERLVLRAFAASAN